MSKRAVAAACGGIAGVSYMAFDHWRDPGLAADFDQWWWAAVALRRGLDPYAVIGPHGSLYQMPWPFYYPLVTAMAVWPLSFLPLLAARFTFVALGSAAFGYAITRRNLTPLFLLFSGSFIEAARLGQWSLFFASGVLVPIWTALMPAKPTTGLITFAGAQRRAWLVALSIWIPIGLASFVIAPSWPVEWLRVTRDAPHVRILLFTPIGWLLVLAALQWRTWEGRLLLAYAVIPHTPAVYDSLPALTLAESRLECLVLSILSLIALAFQAIVVWPNDPRMVSSWLSTSTVALVYLPSLVIVISRARRARRAEGESALISVRR